MSSWLLFHAFREKIVLLLQEELEKARAELRSAGDTEEAAQRELFFSFFFIFLSFFH